MTGRAFPLLPLLAAPSAPPPAPVAVPECHDEVCITCSDAAVEVRVVELHPDGLATVDTGAGLEQVSVALVDAAVGDLVLVHAKEAIARLGAGGDRGRERDDDLS